MAVQCPACGTTIQPGKKFCSNCGAKIDVPEQPAQSVQPVQPAHAAPPPPAQPAQQAIRTPPPAPPAPPPQRQPPPSDRTVALYEQDLPPEPQRQAEFAPKKQAVYPQQSAVPAYQQRPSAPPPPAPPPYMPPKAAGRTGMITYLLYLIATSIPVVGLIVSIIWGVTPDPPDRSNLGKAMIVFNIIWMIVIVFFLYQFYTILSSIADIKIEFGF